LYSGDVQNQQQRENGGSLVALFFVYMRSIKRDSIAKHSHCPVSGNMGASRYR
jgi:hypothetical protein